MLERVTKDTFAEHLGSTFRLHYGAASPLEVQLIEVQPLGQRPKHPTPERQPFSLVFRGPFDQCLPQNMFPFDHDQLGRLEIFIVPIGPDHEGMRYEAVFN